LTPEEARAWDAFVETSLNGTLFHTMRFLGYHPRDRFEWSHARIPARSDAPLALLPAAAAGDTWFSGAGASYGGPVLAAGATEESARIVAREIVEEARRRGYRRVRARVPPPLYEEGGRGLVRAALLSTGWVCEESEVSHSVPLEGRAPADLLTPPARRGAHKAEREGVEVAEESEHRAFHALLAADRARMGLAPTHTAAELEDLAARLGAEQTLLLARLRGELVAGAWLLRVNARVGLSFYVCQDRAHRRLRATNLLMLRALEWAAGRGLTELDLGTSSIRGTLNRGLADFKAAHGARPFARETFGREIA
jgi:CelD/BcsL family acetyltransferase involved in cellulose biosynthesis